jgi:predicted transcriptional regulator of viral defense system
MRKSKIINVLARKDNIIYFEEAAKITNLSRESLRVFFHRLEKAGMLERIEKGKYLIIPIGAEKGKYTFNEFVIGAALLNTNNYSVAYWSALSHHGLTEQIPNIIFLQTDIRKKKTNINVLGINYKIIRVNKEKIFGIQKLWVQNRPVNITDKEKTIIDCLDKPQHCGGLIEVFKALNNIKEDKYSKRKLINYALKIKNSGVIRRLGYICDYVGISIEIPMPKTRNYLYLDPTMPKKGVPNSKWRLIINLDEKFIGELE